MFGARSLSVETLTLFGCGAAFLGVGVSMCVSAYRAEKSSVWPAPAIAVATAPALPPAQFDSQDPSPPREPFASARTPASIFGPPPAVDLLQERSPWPAQAPAGADRPASPSIVLGPSAPVPPARPIELNASRPTSSPEAAPSSVVAPRPMLAALGAAPASLADYDRFTAVYDLSAHTVFLPDGGRLEAHSGLGPLKDDPLHVDQRDRGATPPHVYDLTLREDLFHGVQALRLYPVGGPSTIFGRAGLLAHTYMLGPNGDSNGCVSFRNYDAFLQAFQSGRIKRLAVVISLK